MIQAFQIKTGKACIIQQCDDQNKSANLAIFSKVKIKWIIDATNFLFFIMKYFKHTEEIQKVIK